MAAIRIISWKSDFIRALALELTERHGADMGSALVVFPHGRPARYLRKALVEMEEVPKPCLPPTVRSLGELIDELEAGLPARGGVPRPASELDRAGLLMDLVPELAAMSSGMLARLPTDPDRFLPWGLKLAGLFEELLRHDLAAVRLPHLEGEVEEEAAALLAELDVLYEAYLAALERRGLSTPGLRLKRLLERLDEAAALLAGRDVVLAGFHAPSGGEDKLLRGLWEAGARVYWHTDPGLADDGVADHPSAAEHRAWQRRWRARLELVPAPEAEPPEVRLHEAFDFHSQLAAMERELARDDLSDTAVVLPDTGRLLPVLHHLPDAPVNVSMGYPLERTPAAQLLETAMALQEGRSESGYSWRDLRRLARNPLLRSLTAVDGPEPERPLGLLGRVWAENLAQGERFAPVEDNLPDPGFAQNPAAARALLEEAVGALVQGFEDLSTLKELAEAVDRVLELLLRRGEVEASRPLDAECVHRLRRKLLPELAGSALSGRTFSPPVLFTVLRGLLADERVAFEPEPLTGLQVLGPLEARLLHFDTVVILDATEDKLPGGESFDPLLPDALRHLLSLPDAGHRDLVAGYNIHRLLQGAREAVVVYQSSVQPGLLDAKTVRSRFVEQLLWDMEQQRGELITPSGEGPLRAVRLGFAPVTPQGRELPATEAAAAAMRRLLSRGLSPSRIDQFLRCPKQGMLAAVSGVREPEQLEEEGDRAAHGQLIHELLSDELTPLLNRPAGPGDLDAQSLQDEYSRRLRLAPFFRRMPFDLRMGLETAGRLRLALLVKNFPETTVKAVERAIRTRTETPAGPVTLSGTLDRLDEREGELLVLDYKTGKAPPRPSRDFWDMHELWRGLEQAVEQRRPDFGLLSETAEHAASLQLPLYMLMQLADTGQAPANAAYVKLAGGSEELALFKDDADPERARRAVREQTPLLAGAVALHMAETESYPAREGRHCDFCPYRRACGA
jgi:inactivated superfamily I helicase/RecB family exonuclease